MMANLLSLAVILFACLIELCICHRAIQPPVPGLPTNTDPTKKTTTTKSTRTTPIEETGPFLLDNYLAPSMQAVAYYIELLQYESVEMTTIEPPFSGWEAEGGTTYKPPLTSRRPTTTTKASTVWWKPPSTQSTIWWVPPSTTTKKTTTKTTTTTSRTTTASKPIHDEITTTTQTPWWQTTKTTTKKTTTTTKKPISLTTTTLKPVTWWSPPLWWTSTTTTSKPLTNPSPTPTHNPGLYAPLPPFYSRPRIPQIQGNKFEITTERILKRPQHTTPAYISITSDKNFYSWLFQQKSKRVKPEFQYDFNFLDPLPGALIQDIIYERSELPAISDLDNVNEFLRVYDDNFGRFGSNTGKKKIPVTKPYVEFLMLYDLLKRDAKAMNLSKYEGYTEEMLHELAETSKHSAERQLHILFTRMLLRNEIERTDVVNRVKNIITDLENPNSITAKAMRYFPPLPFSL